MAVNEGALMSDIQFSDTAADRLEKIYLGQDIAAQRADTVARLALQPGERVLDVGSGPGFLAQEMAPLVGPTGIVRGVDISEDLLARATSRNAHAWVSYAPGDATALDEPDGAYDVFVSTQVAEYVPDVEAMCAEAHRVLAPGGRGLMVATDWGQVAWHSEDPARMARVLASFEPHCADPRLPRTLAKRLGDAGLEVTAVSTFPIINLARAPGAYSAEMIPFFLGYVRKSGALAAEEIAAWDAEQARLSAEGRYYFSSSRTIFMFRRPD